MQANLQSANQNREKRYAMNSTICKRHNWVAQSYRTVMEKLRFVCVAVHRWLTLPRKLAQIQQH
jgi:hypothetical protein